MSPHWPVQEGSEPTALVRWNQAGPATLPQHFPPSSSRYNGPNLVLKYDRAQKRLVNIAVDERSSPYYALRDRQGNAIGVTACDIDGDGREEIYFLNTNNAFSGKGCGPWAFPRKEAPTFLLPSPGYNHQLPQGQALPPRGPRFVPAVTQQGHPQEALSSLTHEAFSHLPAPGPGDRGLEQKASPSPSDHMSSLPSSHSGPHPPKQPVLPSPPAAVRLSHSGLLTPFPRR